MKKPFGGKHAGKSKAPPVDPDAAGDAMTMGAPGGGGAPAFKRGGKVGSKGNAKEGKGKISEKSGSYSKRK
jgi:hypothetical protein